MTVARQWTQPSLGREVTITAMDDRLAAAAVQAAWDRLAAVAANVDEALDSARLAAAATDGWFDVVTAEGTVDLGGMVLGYAFEKAAEVLWSWGGRNFSIASDGEFMPGEFMSKGSADGDRRPWRVPIADPTRDGYVVSSLSGHDLRVATSGMAGRQDRLRVPADREPTAGFALVNVTGPDLTWCEVASTALALAGTEGLAGWFSDGFVPQGYGAFCLSNDGEQLTAGIRRRIDER